MDTSLELAAQPQCNYVRSLIKTRVVPSEAASLLSLVLDAGTLERSAARTAIHYLLQRPLRPRYRIPASSPRPQNTLPCETDE